MLISFTAKILGVLLHEGLQTGDATTPGTGTGTDPDPVIEVEIEMTTAGALPDLLRRGEGDRCIEIAIGKGIAHPNTTAEAGVAAVAEIAVIDQVDLHMGQRAEK